MIAPLRKSGAFYMKIHKLINLPKIIDFIWLAIKKRARNFYFQIIYFFKNIFIKHENQNDRQSKDGQTESSQKIEVEGQRIKIGAHRTNSRGEKRSQAMAINRPMHHHIGNGKKTENGRADNRREHQFRTKAL
jgi:hypothetical protein